MNAGEAIATIAGAAVIITTVSSVLRTLVVPRAKTSRLAVAVLNILLATVRSAARVRREYQARDRVLSLAGPAYLLVLLMTWLSLFLLGYGLLLYGTTGLTIGGAFTEAGSSLFTLGFASPRRNELSWLDFVAAATGPITIALHIAYLPILYSAYNQRETEVTLLGARCGDPAWGPEVLASHAGMQLTNNLPVLYTDWERWSATVSESHTTYPVLIHFRSPQPFRSWLVSMLAMMDAAALHLALCPNTAPVEAQLCLRMGIVTLRDLATTEHIPFSPDTSPGEEIDLSYQEFLDAVRHLEKAGFAMERTAEEAWPRFRGWRINYESNAYILARHVEAVPAPWSGPRRREDVQIEPLRPPNRVPRDRPPSAG